jgi:2-phospho-L-lactate/phosphoenolpyruvate guanylyltransferase
MIPRRCSIIIPVKPISIGKSRLRASVEVADDLVIAIALDTIAAVLAAGFAALVVTDDRTVAEAAAALGALIAPDAPDAGLNAAIRHGESLLPTGSTRAALTADLPALRPVELAAAFATFTTLAGRRGYVADHLGTGTTLLIAPPTVRLDPHFGSGSAAAHAASGALALSGAWPSLRLDVDTRPDLDAARALGLGPRTAAAVNQRLRRAEVPNAGTLTS